ncbi:hypothetical protein GGR26_001861 [Lewinella marina]|uniref:Uncharacterized protein n=1 Tax=Neolewinella marina TaxID=438751 RepID=A0A2G0CHH6_9BACT|nr:DUF6428 family protein [Neolewinella marina]NJB86093.1 hypothetical protein [Neolewinella marina]PHK99429.1 hypothetical protein CGL56_08230 [Neolewinella marina]
MKLSQLKTWLRQVDNFTISLPDGSLVPSHFHVTEVGEVTKSFIDCGGTLRRERMASLQLWSADDYNHRLAPGKLVHIIELAETQLGLGDLDLEVEYQGTETIQRFGLAIAGEGLELTPLTTDCLAKDKCGIPEKPKAVSLGAYVAAAASGCVPGNGCC